MPQDDGSRIGFYLSGFKQEHSHGGINLTIGIINSVVTLTGIVVRHDAIIMDVLCLPSVAGCPIHNS